MNQSSTMFSHAASHPLPASDADGASFSPIGQRAQTPGRIIFNAGQSTIACTIRSLSDMEADLRLGSTVGVPQIFKLATNDCGRLRTCRVVSRDEHNLSVAFE